MIRLLLKSKRQALYNNPRWRCGSSSSHGRGGDAHGFSFDKVMLMLLGSCGIITIGDAYLEGMEHLKGSKKSSTPKYKNEHHKDKGGFALTASHMRELERNGFVAIDNVLSMAEVRDARADMACKEKQAEELHAAIPLDEQVTFRSDNFVFMDRSDRDEVIKRRTDPLVREPDKLGGGNGEALLHVQMLLRGMGGQVCMFEAVV